MSDFSYKSGQVSNNLKRSMVDAGVQPRPGVPLHPLLTSVATAVETMGKMTDALRAETNNIKAAAVASSEAALQESLKDLVNRAGGDMAAKERLKWICITCVMAVAVLAGSSITAYYAGKNSESARADTAVQALAAIQTHIAAAADQIIAARLTTDTSMLAWLRSDYARIVRQYQESISLQLNCNYKSARIERLANGGYGCYFQDGAGYALPWRQ